MAHAQKPVLVLQLNGRIHVQGKAEWTPTFLKVTGKGVVGDWAAREVATVRADRLSTDTTSRSGEHRGFVIEAFFKNDGSVTATQRAFRGRFGLYATGGVPERKTIPRWVSDVTASGSALPRKPSGRPRNVRTPENVQRVRASIEQSPRRSVRNHAAAFGISDRTVRRILHADRRMHPYKMMVAQELSVTDWETRRT